MNDVSEEASSEVKLQLLTAVMKMFMKRPPECQDMLGRLLEHTIGQNIHTLYIGLRGSVVYISCMIRSLGYFARFSVCCWPSSSMNLFIALLLRLARFIVMQMFKKGKLLHVHVCVYVGGIVCKDYHIYNVHVYDCVMCIFMYMYMYNMWEQMKKGIWMSVTEACSTTDC